MAARFDVKARLSLAWLKTHHRCPPRVRMLLTCVWPPTLPLALRRRCCSRRVVARCGARAQQTRGRGDSRFPPRFHPRVVGATERVSSAHARARTHGNTRVTNQARVGRAVGRQFRWCHGERLCGLRGVVVMVMDGDGPGPLSSPACPQVDLLLYSYHSVATAPGCTCGDFRFPAAPAVPVPFLSLPMLSVSVSGRLWQR